MRRKYDIKIEASVDADIDELRDYIKILKIDVKDFLTNVKREVNVKNVRAYVERKRPPQFLRNLR